MALKSSFLYRLSVALTPALLGGLNRLLFASCRIEYSGLPHFEALEGRKRQYIFTFWHYSVLFYLYFAKGRKLAAMVSASKDGEYVATLLQRLGYLPVRGSSGRGGVSALKTMLAAMREGWAAAIVADGSRGPALHLQPGAILLAARTGAPILPTAWSASHYLSFKSWDRTVLPRPFSRIVVCFGEPLLVPATAVSAPEREQYRLELENRLHRLYRQAWNHFAKERH